MSTYTNFCKLTSACVVLAFQTALLPVSAKDLPAQSIVPAGTTVNFAQTMDWIDASHFALGRWDGTITIFRAPNAGEFGPIVTQAMALPSGQGVEMLAAIDGTTIASSEGRDGIAIWKESSSTASKDFELRVRLQYDPKYGPANSGTLVTVSSDRYFISGHESGDILIWKIEPDGKIGFVSSLDVKSPDKPANPWGLRNVRGLAVWRDRFIVSGSEDGDLVGLSVPDGKIAFRLRYNVGAQRGINNISVLGDLLLVANCAVGSADKNLWLFDLSSGTPVLADAENLAVDLFKSQVFDFDADLAPGKSGPVFFSSTEEGLLWMGSATEGQLVVSGVTKSSTEGGSIMDVSPGGDLIAVATHTIRLFKVK
jgi:WD40 repeat protein